MRARGADADEAAALAPAVADVWDQHVSGTKENRGEKGGGGCLTGNSNSRRTGSGTEVWPLGCLCVDAQRC